ncbi:MAG: ankyrin repeat domain-containing protein [Alphaproteobacteria bacterium]
MRTKSSSVKRKEFLLHELITKNEFELFRVYYAKASFLEPLNIYGSSLIHVAVENDNHEILRFLIDAKANLNHKNLASYTPLHTAILMGRTEAAIMLIKAGANVFILDKYNLSPLYYAEQKQNAEIIDLITRYNRLKIADPSIQFSNLTSQNSR